MINVNYFQKATIRILFIRTVKTSFTNELYLVFNQFDIFKLDLLKDILEIWIWFVVFVRFSRNKIIVIDEHELWNEQNIIKMTLNRRIYTKTQLYLYINKIIHFTHQDMQ